MRQAIRFLRRGRVTEVTAAEPRTTLLDYLRLTERSTGTKEGCAEGDCGACTVALGRVRDGRLAYEPVTACILLLGQADGAEVVTVEDLAYAGGLHPVQDALVRNHGSQCGFCTPGIVMSLFALYHEGARPPGRMAAAAALAGNLCRCTGYRPILDAALEACAAPAADGFAARREATAAALAGLQDGADLMLGDGERFFAAPASEASLARLVAEHPDAILVGGATDVGLWITKALAEAPKIVWLGRVAGLDRIEDRPDALVIGATATLARAAPFLARIDPDLGELLRRFGSPQVRASGTVGGSIANGSPIGDLAPAFLALGATVVLGAAVALRRDEGARLVPLEKFFLAYRRQDREAGEFIWAIEVAKLGADEAFRCFKLSKRVDSDISAVMGAFKLTLDGRRIGAARLAYGGLAGIPKRASLAEDALAGASLDDPQSWQPALQALAQDFAPLSDHRASKSYRKAAARNLLLKALVEIASGTSRQTRLTGQRDLVEAAE